MNKSNRSKVQGSPFRVILVCRPVGLDVNPEPLNFEPLNGYNKLEFPSQLFQSF